MKNYKIIKEFNRLVLTQVYTFTEGEFVVPDGVVALGRYAFQGCKHITSIKIPSSVKYIREGCFYQCSSLTSIEIPEGVTQIKYGAFYGCTRLQSIKIPDGVTIIGENAFMYCKDLAEVQLSSGLKEIGDKAFMGCKNLINIDIPNTVKSIGDNSFRESGIQSFKFPKSYKGLGISFEGCKNLANVEYQNYLYIFNFNLLRYCHILSLTLPSHVNQIIGNVNSNFKIDNLHILSVEPPDVYTVPYNWNPDIRFPFENISAIYVPKGTKKKYKTHRGWTQVKNIIEEEL